MLVILFCSRLTPEAGKDYQELDAELERLVRDQRGYVTHKGYGAPDGERLTLVWFRDEESLQLEDAPPASRGAAPRPGALVPVLRDGGRGDRPDLELQARWPCRVRTGGAAQRRRGQRAFEASTTFSRFAAGATNSR